jgi:hypothetical protein
MLRITPFGTDFRPTWLDLLRSVSNGGEPEPTRASEQGAWASVPPIPATNINADVLAASASTNAR